MKLSVIVPVYNTARYLEQCVDSILSQTFADIELILVDDGSTDKSGEICDKYICRDNRVRVYHNENKGPLVSRKLGVEQACGEYVTFVDADDFIAEKSYEFALEDMSRGIDVISISFNDMG